MVIEGVALSYEQFIPVKSSKNPERARDISRFGTGTTDIMDILKEAKQKRDENQTPSAWSKGPTIAANFGDFFLDTIDKVKLPESFEPSKENINQVVKLMDWILDISAVVYLQSDHVNDFFLLHGVTGR